MRTMTANDFVMGLEFTGFTRMRARSLQGFVELDDSGMRRLLAEAAVLVAVDELAIERDGETWLSRTHVVSVLDLLREKALREKAKNRARRFSDIALDANEAFGKSTARAHQRSGI